MNILQIQDTLRGLPDKQLQQYLLQPNAAAPGFLVLSELQRRKSLRDNYAAMKEGAPPDTSMAEEFSRGVGGAQAGNYPEAVRGAMPQQNLSAPQEVQPAPGEHPVQTQGFADGGFVPDFLKGMQLGAQQNSVAMPPAIALNRTYMGPGTPSPQGIEQTYFQMAPAAQGGIGGALAGGAPAGGADPGVIQVMAALDGSANGATGSGGDAAGGVSGSGGVGGSASDGSGGSAAAGVGGDDGGTYADGGAVSGEAGSMGIGLIRKALGYADGGEVEDEERPPWATLRRSQQNRKIIRDGIEMPESYVRDTRTLKERFDDSMKVPSYDIGSSAVLGAKKGIESAIEGLGPAYDKNRAMVDAENKMYDQFWTADPGKSVGQSISDKIKGTSVLGLPREVAETGSIPAVPPGPGEPAPVAAGVAGVVSPYPEPNEADGVPNDILADNGKRPSAQASVPATNLGGARPVVPQAVASSGAGGGGAGSKVGGGPLNIGGEGLADYVNQVRGLQAPDGFGEMDRRNQEDLDKLQGSIESEKGLALLMAGLGIAGGESPYAAVNIGKGAQAGVKQWNEATREIRRAERDLRNAQNQITIARANRDERQLEKGITLYARAQENLQRSLDRRNSAGIAAANRADARALKEREFEELAKDREERREQSRITEFGTLSQKYSALATQAETKLAALGANPLAEPGEAAAAKAEAENARQQAQYYSNLHRSAVIDREVKAGRLARVSTIDEARKLPKGTRFVTPDGQLRVVD